MNLDDALCLSLTEKISSLSQTNFMLSAENRDLKKEISYLRKELAEYSQNHDELCLHD